MKRLLDIVAKALSAIFYPLWIPTYGMVLFCIAVQKTFPLPLYYWCVSLGATLLLTGLLPLSLIGYQVKKGYIQNIYIDQREERTMAYVETAMGFGFWWYLLAYILHAPTWLSRVALGATAAIILVAIINRYWKISAHLTSMGGLIGGATIYAFTYQVMPLALIISMLVITLLVMYARLYLKAHTDWQVIAGFALGLLCTWVAALIP